MRLIDALATLSRLEQPVLRTADVMACLGIEKSHASKVMERLADSRHVVRVKRGLWAFPKQLDPMAAAEHLTAPFPSYISLQSALYYHGLISQIPMVTYSVSTARTRTFQTPLGAFSIHHIAPSFFFGYEPTGGRGIQIATPEKAFLDFLYLAPARSKLFRDLPELELPKPFSIKTVRRMMARVSSKTRRTFMEVRLQDLLRRTGS